MKKPTRKTMIRKLDKLVGDIVKLRDGSCVLCHAVNVDPGHLFSRTHYATRWDLGNVFAQCKSCNLKHEHNAYPFFKWYIAKFGQNKLDRLEEKHNQLTHYKTADLLLFQEELEGVLQDYEEMDL